jgi:signal transduction histidine kinase
MLPVSKDTLLRVVRRRTHLPSNPLRVVGIDDWAWRRNHRYASIVCDLERRRVVRLLPDREPATAQAWFTDHPTIEIIARDRGGGYGEAAAKALPKAVQVADRWHLMENASRAFLDAVRKSMRQIRSVIGATTINPVLLTAAERMARAAGSDAAANGTIGTNIRGRPVLATYAPVSALGWLVFVELPTEEAYAPLYQTLHRSIALLLFGTLIAACSGLILVRRIVVPIKALRASAARIGAGDLTQRISLHTGDELEGLADEFNRMSLQLQDSYANLETKVVERTRELALANAAKSRFFAAASHDLRQPLQALGLLVAQLRGRVKPTERNRLVDRIDNAVGGMNELFDALLDISKLDAGAVKANLSDFPVAHVFQKIESHFAESARAKGLSLGFVSSRAWVCSDLVLLERILLNLVSNAVRYTSAGGVLVGCRRRGDRAHIEVWDSGPGIAEDQRQNIFMEFFRLAPGDDGKGLGLGLAIVDRLCKLLEHPIEVKSSPGRGSGFSVIVPLATSKAIVADPTEATAAWKCDLPGALIAIIDNDALVLDSLGGLLRKWGCRVVAGSSSQAIVASLKKNQRPDLIISDYHLAPQRCGIQAIEEVRASIGRPIPAFLISGDTSADTASEAKERHYHLLRKPASAMKLRAMVSEILWRQHISNGEAADHRVVMRE